jgi:hypothetical protein
MEVCDFCTREVPQGEGWVLPANSFEMPPLPWGSQGDWLTCSPCADLIRADDWETLIDYVVDHSVTAKHTGYNPVAMAGLRWSLVYCYENLRKNITGPLRPVRDQS